MLKHEYYNISLSPIPQNIISKYDLMSKKIKICVYARVEKRNYGMVQDVIISHTDLR